MSANKFNIIEVQCINTSELSSDTTINKFETFNYYKALQTGINQLPSNWEYLVICDINTLFIDKDFAEKIENKLKNSDIIQIFDKAVIIDPLNKKIIQTSYSLAYSNNHGIPVSKEYFPIWFRDNSGIAFSRQFYEDLM